MLTSTIEPPTVIETSRQDLEAAFYGVVRLVSGFQDWKVVDGLPNHQKLKRLLDKTSADFSQSTADMMNADPKAQNQIMRKLRAYQQLALLEKFCFSEVIWDD